MAFLARRQQHGVVLIFALIFLVVLSLLAAYSVKSSISTEVVSGVTRTNRLASEAAEYALRYCEESVVEVYNVQSGASPTFSTTFSISMVQAAGDPVIWSDVAEWDKNNPTKVFVLPTSVVNQTGLVTTFSRPPECMVQAMLERRADNTYCDNCSFVVTARGFGPDVAAADANRSRPSGSEAWLQSSISLSAATGGSSGGSGGSSGGSAGGGDYNANQ